MGNIVRARPDGSRLEEVATGFWNPFDLRFDPAGRLLAADNDPDSRGPNRLVHVVPGGDYGYQSLYGGSGIHPYLAWNGELPGTLPFAAELGEAPSGLLVVDGAALPPDYRGTLLATIWEESRIDRVRLTRHGASVRGEAEPLVVGGPDFRPVALAADSRGNVYFTDWVVRAYPNHGRGRIWRLAARPGEEGARTPAPVDALPEDAAPIADLPRARRALLSGDPFERHVGVMALAGAPLLPHALEATRDPDARVRLGALLALRRARHPRGEEVARRMLGDPDPAVRRMALIWAGSDGMLALRPELERALDAGGASPEVFEAYLATVEQLTPEFVVARRERAEQYAGSLPRELPPRFVEGLVTDSSRPAALRAIAITHLPDPAEQVRLLGRLARLEAHSALRLEAVRSLATVRDSAGAAALLAVARDASNTSALRAEALAALAGQPVDLDAVATPLLRDPDVEVRLEAARLLRAEPDPPAPRPESPGEWSSALAGGGDPARGRRVFFSDRAACAQCHTVQRRGGNLGPDLTHIGRSKTRRQLVHAILRPSDEISPEWQGWYVKTPDGQTHVGRQIDVGERGAELYVLPGRFQSFPEVVEYGAVARSLMPEGLERNLSVAELRDLIAFLERGQDTAPQHRTGDPYVR